jgi:hypothetical protein
MYIYSCNPVPFREEGKRVDYFRCLRNSELACVPDPNYPDNRRFHFCCPGYCPDVKRTPLNMLRDRSVCFNNQRNISLTLASYPGELRSR